MTHRDLLAHWNDDHDLAADMDVAYHRARDWRRRNSIPASMWMKFILVCKKKGLSDITLEDLAKAETGVAA